MMISSVMAKKYSLNTENDEVISVEVDGVQYDSPDEIPDAEDRARIEMLISKSKDEGFDEAFDKEFEEEFRQLESQSSRFPAVIAGIFLTIAILMLAIAGVSGVNAGLALSREKSASGRVVDVVARSYQATDQQVSQEYFYPVVEFYLPDESLQRVQLSEGSWPAAYEVGDSVSILYDPERPRQARIKSASSTILLWILPGVTGIVGVVFLAVGLLVGGFLKPNRKAALENSPSP